MSCTSTKRSSIDNDGSSKIKQLKTATNNDTTSKNEDPSVILERLEESNRQQVEELKEELDALQNENQMKESMFSATVKTTSDDADQSTPSIFPTAKASATEALPANSSMMFREWSNDIDSTTQPSTVYRVKCVYGDPTQELSSSIKTAKVSKIKEWLQIRKLSTDGTKEVLLYRLQTDLPSVTLDIDSRECLQRLTASFLFYMNWEPNHLFECKMPARGVINAGRTNLWIDSFGSDIGFMVRYNVNNMIPSLYPTQLDPHSRKQWQDRLDLAGLTWSDLGRAYREPNVLGKFRKLKGSGIDPYFESPSRYSDYGDDEEPGGSYSLQELALEKDDMIHLMYDFGANHNFTLVVLDKQHRPHSTIEETELYGGEYFLTRSVLVEKTKAEIPNQY